MHSCCSLHYLGECICSILKSCPNFVVQHWFAYEHSNLLDQQWAEDEEYNPDISETGGTTTPSDCIDPDETSSVMTSATGASHSHKCRCTEWSKAQCLPLHPSKRATIFGQWSIKMVLSLHGFWSLWHYVVLSGVVKVSHLLTLIFVLLTLSYWVSYFIFFAWNNIHYIALILSTQVGCNVSSMHWCDVSSVQWYNDMGMPSALTEGLSMPPCWGGNGDVLHTDGCTPGSCHMWVPWRPINTPEYWCLTAIGYTICSPQSLELACWVLMSDQCSPPWDHADWWTSSGQTQCVLRMLQVLSPGGLGSFTRVPLSPLAGCNGHYNRMPDLGSWWSSGT